jgi:hypothetical protein
MGLKPRTLIIGGLALLALSAVCYGALRLTYGQRSAYVHVRWAPSVDDAARAQAERDLGLRPVEFREQRTWSYYLSDVSRDNIRRLVTNPAVEDTHYINRSALRLARDAERGEYTTERPGWIADLMEFVVDGALFAGAAALVAGAFNAWRERRAGAAPPAAA